MILRKKTALVKYKVGVHMRIYPTKKVGVVYQQTRKGHTEEFYHTKSTFIYYVIAGKGTWVIEGKKYTVAAGDVVVIPPKNRFYFRGNLKQVLITTPAYNSQFEHHLRDIYF